MDGYHSSDQLYVQQISHEIQARVIAQSRELTGGPEDVDFNVFRELIESIVFSSEGAVRLDS